MLIYRAAYLGHCIDQSVGRNDVSQTQRRKQNFTHCTRVNDVARIIEALKRRQWRADKTELGIIIIFENKSTVSAGELKQGLPPLEAHRYPKRKLM